MILGLIAGGGIYPVHLAQRARARGVKVVTAALKSMTSPDMENNSDAFLWVSLGELSKMLRFFRNEGVQGVILAGNVDHAHALGAKEKLKLMLDPRALKMLASLNNRRANTLLTAIIGEIEKDGMKVLPAFSYLEPDLLKPGPAGRLKPDANQLKDIEGGFTSAKELARLDIGLTCCVRNGVVVAAEALEGTDECIRRAGEILRRRGGGDKKSFTIVKVARPGQDPRFDLPVLGVQTIKIAHDAGAVCLAAESGWTLIMEKEKTLSLAERLGIAIYGISKD
ncbi:MAG: UDP-2,3-diacylglucosamine diphosphatase LpxI [Elusimicrobia bacterium]|nr:UDP-2,3-diacylglucosamine diphosphatase LpxI [Elusimicrobiota bacterium]